MDITAVPLASSRAAADCAEDTAADQVDVVPRRRAASSALVAPPIPPAGGATPAPSVAAVSAVDPVVAEPLVVAEHPTDGIEPLCAVAAVVTA